MRRSVVPIALLFLSAVLSRPLQAQQGSTAAQFLKIGVGARAAGMGEAVVAVPTDATALYWNAAGLAWLPQSRFVASHTSWIEELSHDYVGAVVSLGDGALGVSVTFLNMDEIEITTLAQPRGTGSFYGASDFAMGISYANRMTDRFAVGVTVKYVRQQIFNEVAQGIAFDMGTLLDVGYNGLRIGMALTNFGASMRLRGDDIIIPFYPGPASTPVKAQLETETWPLPTNFRVGIALDLVGGRSLLWPSEQNVLIVVADGNHPIDDVERGNFGAEYSWRGTIFIRAGYKWRYPEQGLTYGAGLRLAMGGTDVYLNYALAKFGLFSDAHRFTLEVGF